MTHDVICEWLGLPAGSWPPDHYRLLGLEPCESDTALIEQRVQQRLESVRGYQMMHPDQATEAMNRLAQAYVCLTEPATKKQYDAVLLGTAAPVAADMAVAASLPRDPLAWLFGPAAPQSLSATPPPLSRLATLPPPAQPQTIKPAEQPANAAEPAELVDSVIAAAQQSGPARRGLGTKRGLYMRVVATRKLLRVWRQLGTYLEPAKRRLTRSVDGPDLSRLFQEMTVQLRRFPRLLGAAGQPGYLVVMLCQQEDMARSFQALDPSQREALSRDWAAVQKLLTAHKDFLRQEIRARRKRTLKERITRATWAAVADRPAMIFVLLLLLALSIALWRTFTLHSPWEMFRGK
jgi:hypothetical protein